MSYFFLFSNLLRRLFCCLVMRDYVFSGLVSCMKSRVDDNKGNAVKEILYLNVLLKNDIQTFFLQFIIN